MIRNLFICLFFFLSYSSVWANSEEEKRTIRNEFYSVTIPADWISLDNKKDDFELKERGSGKYRFHYLGAKIVFEKNENVRHWVILSIRTYRKGDMEPITLEEVEADEIAQVKPSSLIPLEQVVLKQTADSKYFMLTKETEEPFVEGGRQVYDCYYFLQKAEGYVHVLFLHTQRENHTPATKKIINDIIESFTIH